MADVAVGRSKDKVSSILIGTVSTQTDNRTTFAWLCPVGLALLLAALLPSLAQAGDADRFYDASGRYLGRTSTNTANPKQKSLYDPQGRYLGRVMTDENGITRRYDRQGRFLGQTTGSPAQSAPQQ